MNKKLLRYNERAKVIRGRYRKFIFAFIYVVSAIRIFLFH